MLPAVANGTRAVGKKNGALSGAACLDQLFQDKPWLLCPIKCQNFGM
jgi:hypothetical protein